MGDWAEDIVSNKLVSLFTLELIELVQIDVLNLNLSHIWLLLVVALLVGAQGRSGRSVLSELTTTSVSTSISSEVASATSISSAVLSLIASVVSSEVVKVVSVDLFLNKLDHVDDVLVALLFLLLRHVLFCLPEVH